MEIQDVTFVHVMAALEAWPSVFTETEKIALELLYGLLVDADGPMSIADAAKSMKMTKAMTRSRYDSGRRKVVEAIELIRSDNDPVETIRRKMNTAIATN